MNEIIIDEASFKTHNSTCWRNTSSMFCLKYKKNKENSIFMLRDDRRFSSSIPRLCFHKFLFFILVKHIKKEWKNIRFDCVCARLCTVVYKNGIYSCVGVWILDMEWRKMNPACTTVMWMEKNRLCAVHRAAT